MKHKTKVFSLFILSFLLISPAGIFAQKINWISIEEAEKMSEKEPRPVIIDVYTDWCGWCKKMDQTTFSHPKIANYINENFYAVKLDAEQKDPIEFKDTTFTFVDRGRRGYNQFAAEILKGRLSYPTIVYMDENLNLIQPIPGYQTPEKLEPILYFFGTGEYKTTPWEEYQQNFQSKL